ncbi:MAG: response regulator [Ktedonobacteraceae bacterium]|nr:response regulator [Ktedonobacteraceae bacterium]
MLHEQNDRAQTASDLLVYDAERNCLLLDGHELSSDDTIEIQVFGSWVPGQVAIDSAGWYLLTLDQVGIRLHTGLPARSSEFRLSGSASPQPLQQDSSPRILLVDDDQALLQVLPRTVSLRVPAAHVDTASSGQDALACLQTQQYDVVVSDIKMPGMDGLALLARVQELQPDTPTLLITGHGEHNLAVQALRGGAYDYIQKPVERDNFIAALLRAVQTCQLRRQVKEQQSSLELYAHSLERLVQQRSQELVDAYASKDKVISLVSHELNEPIARLKSMIQLLRQKLSGAELSEIVRQSFLDIEHSLVRTEELVQELLNTSEIETDRFILHRRRNDLVALCHLVLEEDLADTPVELTCQQVLNEPIDVEVDGDQIRQVLSLLVAGTYTSATKEEPATITVQQNGHEAIITIRDQGADVGLGVGFYISRKLIERHEGHLKIQNFPGKHRTLFVTLPIYTDPTSSTEDSLPSPIPRTYAIWTITPKGAGEGQELK